MNGKSKTLPTLGTTQKTNKMSNPGAREREPVSTSYNTPLCYSYIQEVLENGWKVFGSK